MNVLLTGGTGVLGRPTVRRLVADGHTVRAVARSPEKAAELTAAGAVPVVVDLFDPAAVKGAVGGSDAILHLATNVPPLAKLARKSAWATHNRLRTEATRNLLDAARAHGVTRFVKESVTFMYPDHGDEWIDESVPFFESANPLVATTRAGEQMVEDLTEHGGEGVVLRFGLFYGFGNRGTRESLRLARLRRSMVAGRPGSYMSSIQTDDGAGAVAAALAAPPGTYNVVDDEPLTRRDYVDAFAAAFDLHKLGLTPTWMIRLVAGKDPARVLTGSQRVSNRRFRDATGWAPAARSAREGWAAIAAVEGPEANPDERREEVAR